MEVQGSQVGLEGVGGAGVVWEGDDVEGSGVVGELGGDDIWRSEQRRRQRGVNFDSAVGIVRRMYGSRT